MSNRVYQYNSLNPTIDDVDNMRLSQRRGAIKALSQNKMKEYEKYKCSLCKLNEPFYKCPNCKCVVCSECTINNSICKRCNDRKEKKDELQSNNLVWYTNGKFKKWCVCCINK